MADVGTDWLLEAKICLYGQQDDTVRPLKGDDVISRDEIFKKLELMLEQEELIADFRSDCQALQQMTCNHGNRAAATDSKKTPAPRGVGNMAAIHLERKHWEEEKASLFDQLDVKDKEIDSQFQLIESLKEQTLEQEDLISASRRDYRTIQQEMASVLEENRSLLRNIGSRFEKTSEEICLRDGEIARLTAELNQTVNSLNSAQSDLQALKSRTLVETNIGEMMLSLLKDLEDVDHLIGGCPAECKPSGETEDIADTFKMARLSIRQLKTELRTHVTRSRPMGTLQEDKSNKQLDEKLLACKRTIQMHEAKMSTLTETIQDIESKKRELQNNVDSLNEEVAKLKAQDALHKVTLSGDAARLEAIMMGTLESRGEQHLKQLQSLRDELASKHDVISHLTETNQKLTLALEKLQADYDKLKSEEADKTSRLSEISLQMDRREQAKQDLKKLQEIVAKELDTLHLERQMFFEDILRSTSTTEKEDAADSSDQIGLLPMLMRENVNLRSTIHRERKMWKGKLESKKETKGTENRK
ncbi:kinesin heavy chain-like isoform X1 [Haliotis cracherodii]|uniref:kinesin heavy chain-like isoform X1 n=1 Tax=Haliotis cracherodii TaxID=6455 RepID=UPI0039E90817